MSTESRGAFHLTRRKALLVSATAGIGAALVRPADALDNTKTAAHQEPGNCATPRSAVAKTQYGKVRGFVDGGVLTFKGVPYGQDTGGDNRWLPARPPKPGKMSTPPSSMAPIAPRDCTITPPSNSRSSRTGMTAT
jgi:para-nitrobenzyl esterase